MTALTIPPFPFPGRGSVGSCGPAPSGRRQPVAGPRSPTEPLLYPKYLPSVTPDFCRHLFLSRFEVVRWLGGRVFGGALEDFDQQPGEAVGIVAPLRELAVVGRRVRSQDLPAGVEGQHLSGAPGLVQPELAEPRADAAAGPGGDQVRRGRNPAQGSVGKAAAQVMP